MDDACGKYRESAKQYNKEVFEKIEKELEEQMLSDLYHGFDS